MSGARDVSVVMLTLDSERRLGACLESVAWAGEVIALDGGSRDGTLGMLRDHGARVLAQDAEAVRQHGGNFDVARNDGLDQARGGWVLVVDSDEVVPAPTRDAILAAIESDPRVAFRIPRRNLYWGRPCRILGEDLQLRLLPRGSGRYEGSQLDRPPVVDCPVRDLAEPLLHYQDELLRKLRERTDQRARVAARAAPAEGESVLRLFTSHFRWYLRRQESWRDGPRGIALAALYAAYPALTFHKAGRLRRRGDVDAPGREVAS